MTSPAEQLRSQLTLFNTLTHEDDPFAPADGETVRMYLCGPTVYSSPHIGNMRTYLFADVLRRTLALTGWKVDAAMNITDVGHLTGDADTGDDKMAKAAAAERLTAWQVAEKYTADFFADSEALNISPLQHVLKATDHIGEQIALATTLDEKGVLYRTDDGVYFDTSKVPDYGKLTPNDERANLRAGERVAMGGKRHATDFAVWKYADDSAGKRDMEWDSPWGVGFPGWHLECSAMAIKALGETLDLHLGGIDHIAIHHTNEIAQSETATGKPFSRWWMHGAFLILEGERRMGKSEGNKITLVDLDEWGYSPMEFRYLVLQSHYRSPLSFSKDTLESAATAYRRLQQHVANWREEAGDAAPAADWESSPYVAQFISALAEDINLPKAIAVLWNLVRDHDVDAATKLAITTYFDQVFGLRLDEAGTSEEEIPAEVAELAARRWEMRLAKDWDGADRLREELREAGYAMQDGREDYQLVRL